jgi:hypothetical protein
MIGAALSIHQMYDTRHWVNLLEIVTPVVTDDGALGGSGMIGEDRSDDTSDLLANVYLLTVPGGAGTVRKATFTTLLLPPPTRSLLVIAARRVQPRLQREVDSPWPKRTGEVPLGVPGTAAAAGT